MKKIVLGIIVLIVLAFVVVPLEFNTHDPKFDAEGFEALNAYRSARDLGTVERDEGLCSFAELRVREVSIDWSHYGFRKRVDDKSAYTDYCPECSWLGENLARYSAGHDSVIAWQNSEAHNEVLLDPVYNSGCMMTDKEYTVLILGEKEYGVQN